MFGTLGWIVAGIIVSRILQGDTTALPMYIAGIGGILTGLYAFTLPNVPPAGAGRRFSARDILGIDALARLKSRPFVIFIVAVGLTSIPLATYFAYVPVFLRDAGVANPAFKMTFGQMSEVLFLLLLPWFFCGSASRASSWRACRPGSCGTHSSRSAPRKRCSGC
jgi:hypothetical protein